MSLEYLQLNLAISNSANPNIPLFRTQTNFPSRIFSVIYYQPFQTPAISNCFSFPLRVRNSGVQLYLHSFSFIFIGFAVSGLMLRLKAKELSTDPSFKASLGWYQNWKRRHSVSFRAKTTLAQRLPDDMEEKVVQFHRFIIAARQRIGYPLSRIYNMDETPMRFELPSTRTLEFSGNRTVPVQTCGEEKCSFTVTLAVAADGTKFPPKDIFKGVRVPIDLNIPNSLRVSFHKKGWMDELGVKEWIRQCLPWTPCNK